MAIQLIEKNGGMWSETRTNVKLSHAASPFTLSQSAREISTVLTANDGWQEGTWEAAKKGCPFSIEGVYTTHDISFCNLVAATYGYQVTVQRGLAAFNQPLIHQRHS